MVDGDTDNKIKSLVLQHERDIPDREGFTELTKFASKLSHLPPMNEEKVEAEWYTAEVASSLDEFSDYQVNTLSNFIELSSFIPAPNIVQKFKKKLSISLRSSKDIQKRAILIRLLTLLRDDAYLLSELEDEVEIKKQLPDIWISILANFDWHSATERIEEMLKMQEYAFEELYLNLPVWLEKPNGRKNLEDAFNKWYPYLEEEDQVVLKQWAKDRGIHIIQNELQPGVEFIRSIQERKVHYTSLNGGVSSLGGGSIQNVPL
ncbi:MAG: hypothetical protein JKX76_02855 [Colwellia sp.]|nr:hypothetical protein [Colwellia sp.]